MAMVARVFFLCCVMISQEGEARSNISYQNFQRLNDPKRMVKDQDRLRLNIDEDFYFSTSSLTTDISVEMYFADRSMNYSVGEAYYFFSYYDLDFSVGRKILDWNPNEKFWGNNYLNSRRNFTLLDTKREGLLGLHHTSKIGGRFEYDIFFSYFHIPTLNPSVKIENKKVISDSEWVNLPPERTTIIGEERPIAYYLNRPKERDTILKKSLGGRLSYAWEAGNENRPGKFSLYGIYKPENSLRINGEAFYVPTQREFSVVANPIVNHHILLGFNATQNVKHFGGTWTLSSGVELVDPNAKIGKDFDAIDPAGMEEANRQYDSDFFVLKPNYERESYWQGRLTRSDERATYSLQYFKLLSRPLLQDDFYSPANRWVNALGVEVKANLDQKFDLGLDLKYDFDRKDTLVVLEAGYMVNQDFLVGLGFEMLASPDENSFWAPYRANDSLFVRLGHLF